MSIRSGANRRARRAPNAAGSTPRPRSAPAALDVLRWPVLGPFLRWRLARPVMQGGMLLLAAAIVAHGLLGPRIAPKNLATLVVWVHYRGALVLALLLFGNLFCMACPFLLPRELARKLRAPTLRFPRALRSKWIAVVLLVAILYSYELFDLWADPRWTAALVLMYFAGALVVDALFRGAPFCKYVCPIGQFNFLASTCSPLEVKVREPEVCGACVTKDCIRGRRAGEDPQKVMQRGCELALFLPQKIGNLDCTFCLDCVHACPEDNVGIVARVPAEELLDPRWRSGIGRPARRADWTALAIVFAFGALLNAFGMVSPVYALMDWLAELTGIRSEAPLLGALFVVALVIEPVALLMLAAWISIRWSRGDELVAARVTRYAIAFLPLGFGVWLAHYAFHFFTGLWTVVPVAQHALRSAGIAWFGEPNWRLGGISAEAVWPLELCFLGLGAAGTLAVLYGLSRVDAPDARGRAFAPWATLCVLLLVAAVWLLAQPMEMRGTFV